MKTIFERSRSGRRGLLIPPCDVPEVELDSLIPRRFQRGAPPALPEVDQLTAVRHYTALSRRNHGVDSGFYPLGSCTMKYNPKVAEDIARLAGFARLHPLQPAETCQGALALMHDLERYLAEIAGMARVTLQPAAGSHGELLGLMIIKAFMARRGDGERRRVILVPDTSHGTNPASAALAGYRVVQVRSGPDGDVDIEDLAARLGEDTAALMLTNPSTLGLFERRIEAISGLVHRAGGLLYYDGANMNAIMGISRPGDMGFDIVHFNLHKTFATPHGGGGPGSGPVGVVRELVPFLPVPVIEKGPGGYYLDHDRPLSVGKLHAFYGNFGVTVKAYAYIRSMGPDGLRQVSEDAVLSANYLLSLLRGHYDLPFDRPCMHEFVLSARKHKELGVAARDIAKRILDYGFHPPTTYFPLTIAEALMVEPTESESVETLDAFAEAMVQIARDAVTNPEMLRTAPHTTAVRRLDEVAAARNPVLRWKRRDSEKGEGA
ncbi:MAG: aminomethyl-transferring glycine dehydrogenase subunit GcvPB [Firmicutes bacterium]|nr:aminomethyl-transferring glycine dehydrogenase subunit GcvPB [Bacillota bacterium]